MIQIEKRLYSRKFSKNNKKRENKDDKNGKMIAKTDDLWSLKYVRRKKRLAVS